MPVVLALTFGFLTHSYLLGLSVLPVIGTLCLGYFFRGDQDLQWLGRGLWLGLQALVLGIGITVSGHLSLYFYVPYVLVAFGLAAWLYRIEQVIGDIIFGIWLGSIVFFVR